MVTVLAAYEGSTIHGPVEHEQLAWCLDCLIVDVLCILFVGFLDVLEISLTLDIQKTYQIFGDCDACSIWFPFFLSLKSCREMRIYGHLQHEKKTLLFGSQFKDVKVFQEFAEAWRSSAATSSQSLGIQRWWSRRQKSEVSRSGVKKKPYLGDQRGGWVYFSRYAVFLTHSLLGFGRLIFNSWKLWGLSQLRHRGCGV